MLEQLVDQDLILLFARIIVGIIFIYFGWPKIKDLQEAAHEAHGMGFKPGWFWGTILAFVEFFGGFALVLGFYAEIAAALLGFEMIVGTIWKIKGKMGFGNYTYDLLILALCLLVYVQGAGSYFLTSYQVPQLTWGILLIVLVIGAIHAYLPEILGERYRKWGEKKNKS